MGTTASGYPYPELTDTPDAPRDLRALAEAVEAGLKALDAAILARVAITGGGVLGTRDPALPLKVVGGSLTTTSSAAGVVTIPTGLDRYLGSLQVTQAGVSVSAYAHFIVRTDQGTPGQAQVFVGNSLGQGLPNTSVALNWLAIGQ